jgi:UDP-N-acetylglucosamine 2-epimerase (non-hydrolysing)
VFGHIEAGLRSFDRSMPEEVNRVVADHVTDFAFAPTDEAATNLAGEGITEKAYVTGNTVVDACHEHRPIAENESSVLSELNLRSGEYAVATIHRPRNTDTPERLRRVLASLDGRNFPVVLPAHPRLIEETRAIGFEPAGSLRLVEPLDYLDFLELVANARVVVTDSGGVQEEASVIEVPCLTVRPNTERPETIEAGVNELLEPEDMGSRLDTVFGDDAVHESMAGHPNLYGDGMAGTRIVEILLGEL